MSSAGKTDMPSTLSPVRSAPGALTSPVSRLRSLISSKEIKDPFSKISLLRDARRFVFDFFKSNVRYFLCANGDQKPSFHATIELVRT